MSQRRSDAAWRRSRMIIRRLTSEGRAAIDRGPEARLVSGLAIFVVILVTVAPTTMAATGASSPFGFDDITTL